MLKMKLNIKAIVLSLGLISGPAVFAQTAQPAESPETQQINVSDAELEKFANAIQALQTAEQDSQQKMMAIVEEQDLSIEKFNEIHQAKMQNAEVKASEEDQKKHQKAVAKLEELQSEIMQLMESIVTSKGLSMERFQQIAAAMQSSPELQQRLQQLMMG